MSDQDALLAAIRQSPDDDAPRLIYADWLDEHGDPDRAEFIRLQIKIDPFRQLDSDLDRWRRAVIDGHLNDPVPDHFPPELRHYADLARRDRDLLKARRWEWLAPLARVVEDNAAHLRVMFRRGFAEEVEIAASVFQDSGDLVREACPMLRRLTLFGPREQVPELAGMSALGGIPELVLADWITDFDARALAPTFALRDVESLTLWVGSRHDSDVVRSLATRPWEGGPGRPLDGPHLANLREVILVQPHGGLIANDRTGQLDRRAADLAGLFNRFLGRAVARVERPFGRRFPLFARVGHGLFAGHIRGRPVVVVGGRQSTVLEFDAEGRLKAEDMLDLEDTLHRPPGLRQGAYDEGELLAVLRHDYGFEPGLVFVREFDSEAAEMRIVLWGNYEDVVQDPDSRLDGDDHEEACANLARYWIMDRNFAIEYGDHCVAGPDGVIFSS